MEDGYRERGLRNRLIETLAKKGITDTKVLEAMRKVPRHIFFDPALLSHAYEDKAFPIGYGQTISQPYTVAFQTEKLTIQPTDKVLEIGTGSGYQCAVILALGATVYTVEYVQQLYLKAKKILPQINCHPHFVHGDGSLGLPAKAPFHKIIVTAGAPSVPNALVQQLAIGGKLIIPVGDRRSQAMLLITRKKDSVETEKFNNFAFVPLVGAEGWSTLTK